MPLANINSHAILSSCCPNKNYQLIHDDEWKVKPFSQLTLYHAMYLVVFPVFYDLIR